GDRLDGFVAEDLGVLALLAGLILDLDRHVVDAGPGLAVRVPQDFAGPAPGVLRVGAVAHAVDVLDRRDVLLLVLLRGRLGRLAVLRAAVAELEGALRHGPAGLRALAVILVDLHVDLAVAPVIPVRDPLVLPVAGEHDARRGLPGALDHGRPRHQPFGLLLGQQRADVGARHG